MENDQNKILESVKYVVDNSDFVKINKLRISEYIKDFKESKGHYWLQGSPFNIDDLNKEEKLMFIVIFNSISFSYWGNPYWNVEYKGKTYTRGSWSLVACIFRAKEQGRDIFNPKYLSTLSKEELAIILKGNTEIPLLDKRLKILNEIGTVLIKNYNGKFSEVIKQSEGDAIKLLNLILNSFPSFQDYESYKSRKIYFQKRAQGLVEGIYSIFNGKGYGKLVNINFLTALADYIIPNLLREFGIIEYSKELIKKIDNKIMLEKGSPEEVEIRANTIWVVELMRKELELQKIIVSALNINDYLWTMGGKTKTSFHLTRTTSY